VHCDTLGLQKQPLLSSLQSPPSSRPTARSDRTTQQQIVAVACSIFDFSVEFFSSCKEKTEREFARNIELKIAQIWNDAV
jgi:hypothetical protein